MKKCKFCGKEFKDKGIHNHERHCKLNPDYESINHEYLRKNAQRTNLKNRENRQNSLKEYELVCIKCGKPYHLTLTQKKFLGGHFPKCCSGYCAHSRIMTTEIKEKIKNTILNKRDNYPKQEFVCKVCNQKFIYHKIKGVFSSKKFCCKDCFDFFVKHRIDFLDQSSIKKMSMAGRKSAEVQANKRRSKNEILFFELCDNFFKNVDHNKPIFNGWDADIIIHDIKYAILWNGAWHYKQLTKKSSLKQIQNRDWIKVEEIKRCGYTPYIIKDMGKFNKLFVINQFESFIKILNIDNIKS